MENLEDQEFKKRELSEEWWFYQGENGVYPYINALPANQKLPLVKPTYRYMLTYVGTDLFAKQLHPLIWINSLMKEYEVADNLLEGEIRRIREEDLIYPKWIITDLRFKAELKAVESRDGLTIRVNRYHYEEEDGYSIWYTPDKNGHLLKSKRNKEDSFLQFIDFLNEDTHISETCLDDASFTEVIENNGTVKELIEKIKNIMVKYGII